MTYLRKTLKKGQRTIDCKNCPVLKRDRKELRAKTRKAFNKLNRKLLTHGRRYDRLIKALSDCLVEATIKIEKEICKE